MDQPNDPRSVGRSLYERELDGEAYNRGYRAGLSSLEGVVAALEWCEQNDVRVSWWGSVVIEWCTSENSWSAPPDYEVEARTFLGAVAKAKAVMEEEEVREKEEASD